MTKVAPHLIKRLQTIHFIDQPEAATDPDFKKTKYTDTHSADTSTHYADIIETHTKAVGNKKTKRHSPTRCPSPPSQGKSPWIGKTPPGRRADRPRRPPWGKRSRPTPSRRDRRRWRQSPERRRWPRRRTRTGRRPCQPRRPRCHQRCQRWWLGCGGRPAIRVFCFRVGGETINTSRLHGDSRTNRGAGQQVPGGDRVETQCCGRDKRVASFVYVETHSHRCELCVQNTSQWRTTGDPSLTNFEIHKKIHAQM